MTSSETSIITVEASHWIRNKERMSKRYKYGPLVKKTEVRLIKVSITLKQTPDVDMLHSPPNIKKNITKQEKFYFDFLHIYTHKQCNNTTASKYLLVIKHIQLPIKKQYIHNIISKGNLVL